MKDHPPGVVGADHRARDGRGDIRGGLDVHGEHLDEPRRVVMLGGATSGDPGVRDDTVDPPERRAACIDEPVGMSWVANIARDCEHMPAFVGDLRG